MFNAMFITLVSLALLPIALGHSKYTNLPKVPPGVFHASTRIEINTTVEAAFHTLTDFPSYGNWNPFVRYARVTSAHNVTLRDQRPVEGKYLFFRVQIPPLPLPVNKNTRDNPENTQYANEHITHVQPESGRLAWDYFVENAITSTRWQAVSDMGNGCVLYESKEEFNGPLAGVLKETLGANLQKSFDAQGKGLKLYLEGKK